jgi:hypothetical protein
MSKDLVICADVLSSLSYAPAMSSYLPHVTHLFIASSFHPLSLGLVHPLPLPTCPSISTMCLAKRFLPKWPRKGIKRVVPTLTLRLSPSSNSQCRFAPSFPRSFLPAASRLRSTQAPTPSHRGYHIPITDCRTLLFPLMHLTLYAFSWRRLG